MSSFVADHNDSAIKEILAAGGYNTVNSLGGGFSSPDGVAVDGTGNVFVADETDGGQIVEIQRSQPPSLSFVPTPVGSTSSDSPESVVFQNISNSTLTGGGTLSDLLDFTVGAGPGVVPDCNGVLALVPGAECNVSLSFTPQSAGQLNATLTLSDNSLNGNPAIQTIQISGIGGIPQITAISPNYGAPAALITITGNGFGTTQGGSVVTVGGAPSYVVSWSNTAISILVPSRATTGNIVVTVGGVSSNGEPFTFYPYPAITNISPASGAIGAPVTITGTGLLDGEGNGVVTFNGIPAAILSQSSTSIQVDVPAGATTGPVSVHANGDTVKSFANFTVTSPQISGINPNYGAPAAPITITGINFGATQGNGSRHCRRSALVRGFLVEHRNLHTRPQPGHHRKHRRHRSRSIQQRRTLHLLSLSRHHRHLAPQRSGRHACNHHRHRTARRRQQSYRHLQRHSCGHPRRHQHQHYG